MASKRTYNPRSSAAVKTRSRVGQLILWVILVLLILAAIGVIIALKFGSRPSASLPSAVPIAEPVPGQSAAPVTEPVPAEELPDVVPVDASLELTTRRINRRDGFPLMTWNPSSFTLDDRGRMRYSGKDVRVLQGIDVSEHQFGIDWNKVAADGIDFAIIRVGYRGTTAGGLYMDDYFERNIKGALAAGLKVGVYFYSQAINTLEAQEEAEFVLDAIRDYNVELPICFDWEIVGGEEARTYAVTRPDLRDCALVFCQTIEDAGYTPMVYFTQYLGYRKYNLRSLTEYGFWFADYTAEPCFAYHFDMWQYSEGGEVNGIDGIVDMNILFIQ